MRSGIITLLTDFGAGDYFVGVMKGVILSRLSEANLVDITHDILPHDIHAAVRLAKLRRCSRAQQFELEHDFQGASEVAKLAVY